MDMSTELFSDREVVKPVVIDPSTLPSVVLDPFTYPDHQKPGNTSD